MLITKCAIFGTVPSWPCFDCRAYDPCWSRARQLAENGTAARVINKKSIMEIQNMSKLKYSVMSEAPATPATLPAGMDRNPKGTKLYIVKELDTVKGAAAVHLRDYVLEGIMEEGKDLIIQFGTDWMILKAADILEKGYQIDGEKSYPMFFSSGNYTHIYFDWKPNHTLQQKA